MEQRILKFVSPLVLLSFVGILLSVSLKVVFAKAAVTVNYPVWLIPLVPILLLAALSLFGLIKTRNKKSFLNALGVELNKWIRHL